MILLKAERPEELFAAIRAAARGRTALSAPVASRVMDRMRGAAGPSLTDRERDILGQLAQGLGNRETARALFISEATVKTHLGRIHAKLGVDTRGPTEAPRPPARVRRCLTYARGPTALRRAAEEVRRTGRSGQAPATARLYAMTTTGSAAVAAPVAPAPRWARRAAHAIALCALPSALWRIAMASGVYVGYSDQVLRDAFGIPGWGIAYVVGLAVVSELAALFPLLLVSDRWQPLRPRALAALAWTASALTIVFVLSQLVVLFTVESRTYLSDTAETVWAFFFGPLAAVPFLLTAVTWSYSRRRRA